MRAATYSVKRSIIFTLMILSALLTGCFLFPNTPPVAQFQVAPPGGDAPITVQFDAQSSHDPDGIGVARTDTTDFGTSGTLSCRRLGDGVFDHGE